MLRYFTLEYWIDEEWYVGRLKEVPGAFSQGETLEELEKNIREAYRLMMLDDDIIWPSGFSTSIMHSQLLKSPI